MSGQKAIISSTKWRRLYCLSKICTADIEWRQNEGFPNGTTWHGANEVIKGVFEVFDDNWDSCNFSLNIF